MREIARYAPLRVEHAVLLEYLGNDGNGGVHGVGDNKNERLRRGRRDTGGQVADNTCVDLYVCEQCSPQTSVTQVP